MIQYQPWGFTIKASQWKTALTDLFCPETVCMMPRVIHFINLRIVFEIRASCLEDLGVANRVCVFKKNRKINKNKTQDEKTDKIRCNLLFVCSLFLTFEWYRAASLISVTCFTSLLIVPSCISIQERHRTHTSTLRYWSDPSHLAEQHSRLKKKYTDKNWGSAPENLPTPLYFFSPFERKRKLGRACKGDLQIPLRFFFFPFLINRKVCRRILLCLQWMSGLQRISQNNESV